MRVLTLAAVELRRYLRGGFLRRAAVGAILLVPLLYGGTYLWAFWNPDSRLDRLPVALAVDDVPAAVPSGTISAGADVAGQLRARKVFDWQLVSASTARSGVADGKYAMGLVIPRDFSSRLASAATGKAQPAVLELRTNDAVNYLATRLGSAVFAEVRAAASARATQAYLDQIFLSVDSQLSGVRKATSGASQLSTGLVRLADGSTTLARGAAKAAAGAGQLSQASSAAALGGTRVADGAATAANGAAQLDTGAGRLAAGTSELAAAAARMSAGTAQLTAGLRDLQAKSAALPAAAAGLAQGSAAVSSATRGASAGTQRASQDAEQLAQLAASLSQRLSSGLAGADPGEVASAIDAANVLRDQTAALTAALARQSVVERQVATSAATLDAAASATARQVPALPAGIRKATDAAAQLSVGSRALAAGSRTVQAGTQALHSGAAQLAGGTAQLGQGSSRLADGLQRANRGAVALADGSRRVASGASQVDGGLDTAVTGSQALASGLSTGVRNAPTLVGSTASHAAVMSNPVQLRTERQNRAANYGSGLSPYFLPLALWVGAWLAYLFLRPLNARAVAAGISGWRAALAGWLPVAALSLVQSVILLLVLRLGLGLSPARGVAFAGFLFLSGLTFAAILQMLTAVLGTPGRFAGIVLLVLQLVTSGGTYPVETEPALLRWISPFLPMTHMVRGLRASVLGGSEAAVLGPAAVLLAYLVGALALTSLAAVRARRWTPARLWPELEMVIR